MSQHDPPAADLGALRARHVERPIVLPSGVPATYCPACGSPWPCDAARLYDAQAARLAAVEQERTQQAGLALALAEGIVTLGRELGLPAEMAWLWKLATSTLDGAAGAVGAGEAHDG